MSSEDLNPVIAASVEDEPEAEKIPQNADNTDPPISEVVVIRAESSLNESGEPVGSNVVAGDVELNPKGDLNESVEPVEKSEVSGDNVPNARGSLNESVEQVKKSEASADEASIRVSLNESAVPVKKAEASSNEASIRGSLNKSVGPEEVPADDEPNKRDSTTVAPVEKSETSIARDSLNESAKPVKKSEASADESSRRGSLNKSVVPVEKSEISVTVDLLKKTASEGKMSTVLEQSEEDKSERTTKEEDKAEDQEEEEKSDKDLESIASKAPSQISGDVDVEPGKQTAPDYPALGPPETQSFASEDLEAFLKEAESESTKPDVFSFAVSSSETIRVEEGAKRRRRRKSISSSHRSEVSSIASSPSTYALPKEEETVDYVIKLDLDEYYAQHAMLSKDYEIEKYKNNYLQKKVAEYYKKRKMFHVLTEGHGRKTAPGDSQKKYEKQLDDTANLIETSKREHETGKLYVQELRERCSALTETVETLFKNLQQAETEVGKELMSSDSLAERARKILEYHLKRQRNQLSLIIQMRLDYIKIRNKLTEKQEALNALDNLGPNLHLIDYEQLRHDNRNLHDKLEEKEIELTRIRVKCQNAMQCLAHRREKADYLDDQIDSLHDRIDVVAEELDEAREQSTFLKKERDDFRNKTNNMKYRSGLLTKPKLLRDMQSAMEEIKILGDLRDSLRSECIMTDNKIRRLRINMGSVTKLHKVKAKVEATEQDSDNSKDIEFDFAFQITTFNSTISSK